MTQNLMPHYNSYDLLAFRPGRQPDQTWSAESDCSPGPGSCSPSPFLSSSCWRSKRKGILYGSWCILFSWPPEQPRRPGEPYLSPVPIGTGARDATQTHGPINLFHPPTLSLPGPQGPENQENPCGTSLGDIQWHNPQTHPPLEREVWLRKHPFARFCTVINDIKISSYFKNQPTLLS